MLRLESSWHGRSVDHVLIYPGRQIVIGSQKPSRITRQKTCCASESNASVRVVFANRSGFDAPIGVALAWEARGSCLNIFRTKNCGRISETITNYEAKDLLRKQQTAVGSQKPSRIMRQKTCCASESNTSVREPENLHELRGKRLVAQVSQTRRFALYSRTGVVLMLRLESSWHGRSVDHVLTYSGRQIAVGSQKPSRITRQKTFCTSKSNTSALVVFANGSGFDAPIEVVLAWEECGSYLNIFRTKNRGRISETFTNYEEKVLLRKRQIAVGSQKPSRIMRLKTCCASESNTSVRVVFANRSGFDAPIGVVLAWEERGSCLNIFRTTNRGRMSETFTNYEAKDLLRKNLHELRGKRLVAQLSQTRRFELYSRTGMVLMLRLESSWHGRSVDHVLTYSGRQIAVGSQKPSRITRNLHELRGKRLVAQVSQTRRFANRSGFDAPIGVVLAWEKRGSCLTFSGRQIAVRSQKPSRITRQKTCCASESKTSIREPEWFDAPIGVDFAWEELGSCLNIFRTTNRGQISETFTNYEAKDLLRK
ncbi:uncharacterized protein G2W53_009963 [Senna tora]|uniref:Uncharacterized protein n=1 Tax=Senna tora TaxID=362788 RepID=A0A834WZ33_9FABA|nr:uncharacterized protein G2W53_009963 [Senna tora]